MIFITNSNRSTTITASQRSEIADGKITTQQKSEQPCFLLVSDIFEVVVRQCDLATTLKLSQTRRSFRETIRRLGADKFCSSHFDPITNVFWNTIGPRTIVMTGECQKDLDVYLYTTEDYRIALKAVHTPSLKGVFTDSQQEVLEKVHAFHKELDTEGSDKRSANLVSLLQAISDEHIFDRVFAHPKMTQLSGDELVVVLSQYVRESVNVCKLQNATSATIRRLGKHPLNLQKKILLKLSDLIFDFSSRVYSLTKEKLADALAPALAVGKLECLPCLEELAGTQLHTPTCQSIYILSATLGRLDIFETLLKDPKNSGMQLATFSQVIEGASTNGHVEVLAFMRSRTKMPGARDLNLAVQHVSENGHLKALIFLLSDPTRAEMLGPECFNQAVLNASQNRYWEIVKFLLLDPARSAMLTPDCFHWVLKHASRNGYCEVLTVLFSEPKRAAMLEPARFNWAVWDASEENGHGEALEFLLSDRKRVAMLNLRIFNRLIGQASRNGDCAFVEFLLSNLTRTVVLEPFNFNLAVKDASQNGHHKVLELLLSNPTRTAMLEPFDFNLAVKDASQNGHRKVLELLLSDPTRTAMLEPFNLSNVLWNASQNGQREIVEFLLSDPLRGEMFTSFSCYFVWNTSENGRREFFEFLSLGSTKIVMFDSVRSRCVVRDASINWYLEVLEFLFSEPRRVIMLQSFSDIIRYVAINGNLKLLKFLLSDPIRATMFKRFGCDRFSAEALKNGHREVALFLSSFIWSLS